MNLKIYKIVSTFFALILVNTFAFAQNKLISGAGHQSISFINSSIVGTNPIIVKVKANAELPATLIENYLNQDKSVLVESEGTVLFSGQIHKKSSGIANLTIISKSSGSISFLDNSKIYATNGTLNLNIETDATIAVANLALLETNGGNIRLRALKDSESIANTSINSILIKGKLNASSTYKGGKIVLESDHIKLEDQSKILAQGEQGGGTILIGGDWQGSGTLRQATTVTMNKGAIIDASAIQNGNGGTVVLWSDIKNSNSVTKAQGSIYAKAGSQAGNGGKVETSGYMLNVDGISVSTQASKGLNGQWLLDPRDITISSGSDSGVSSYTANTDNAVINVTTLANALASNNVTVFTGSTGTSQAGNITVSSAINAGGTGTLTLWAANTITINADITRSSTGGLTLRAGSGSVTGSGVLNLSAGTTLEISHGSTISNNIVVGTGGATFKLSQQLDAQVLIVAGGGAGGGNGWAGGGGGGGVIYGNTAISSGTTTITVGAGGSGQASSNGLGKNGGNSQFGTVTAIGGGGGAGYGWGNDSIAANGAAGGSGGGVGEDNYTSQMQGGAASTQTVPSGFTAYGNPGGNGSYTTGVQAGSGGGGASSPGVGTSAYRTPGGGGNGITFNISGSNQTYGGGGGGATCSTCGTQGSGGSGGGGAGGDAVGVNGTNGLGGGAGGSHSAANATGGSGVVVVRYSGTTAMATGGTITTSGNSTIHTFSSVGATDFVVNGSFSASLTGAISGSGPLTVNANSGSLTFSGTNTYTGSTTISAGKMILANATGTGIHDSSATIISSGAILDLRFSETIGSLAGAGIVTTGTSGAKTLTSGSDNSSTTFSGVIQNGSGSLVLTKVGSGTLTLTGNNTYTGLTTVSAGTLKFAPSSTFDMNMPGGIVNNSDFIFDGTNGGGLGGMFFITGASGSGTWNITGTTSGRGQYQNRLILNGSTTISGQVTVTNYGNLWLENTNINATSPIFLNGANTYLNLYALSSTVMKIGALSGNGKVDAAGNGNTTILTLSLGNDNGTATFSGTLLNSGTTSLSLTKEGTGIQTLSGLSDYRGITNINGGTLKVSSTGKIYQTDITVNLNVNSGAVLDVYNWAWGGSLGNLRFDPGNLVINGGTILYSGITGGDWRSFTVGNLGATFENPTDGVTWNLNNSAQAPVISGNLTFTGAGNFTLGHTITGSGYSLIKNGSGTLILTGNNTYTGVTTINAGTLTFRNDAPNLTSSSFVGPGALVVEPNGTSFTSSYTFNETLSSVTKLGSLTLGKSGNTANITNSNALDINGPITIHAGTLTLTGGLTTSNSSTGNIGLTVATVTGANITLATGRALTITQSGNGTYAGVISGTDATFTKAGAGALYLTGVSTYTGGTTISAGFLELNTTGRISGNIVNNGQLSFNQDASLTYSDIISGTGTVIKYGTTTLTLTGANTYSGGTTVSGGTLRTGIASTGTVTNGPFGTGLVTVGSGFTLDMNGFTVANALSLGGVGISSNGALINSGAAASTTGAVTITAPTAIGGSGAITMSGAVSASTHLVTILNAVGVTAENTSNSIATVAITNSALILKTTASLAVNASSLSGATRLQSVSASRDITVSGAITNNTNANTLTLMASRDILIAAAISGATGKSLTTNFYSDVDNSGGGGFKSTVSTATISTFGGDITIRGGTMDTTAGCNGSYSCIAGYASFGSGTNSIGAYLLSSLNAAGGNIAVYGRGNPTASTAGAGIYLDFVGDILSTTGTGTITLDGFSTGAERGIYHVQGNVTAGTGLISINAAAGSTAAYSGYRMNAGSITSSGALSIAGTGGTNEYGVYILGTGSIVVTGDITINGQNANRNWGVSIEVNKIIQSTAGNISVTAEGTQGFYLVGSLIAGNNQTTPSSGGTITINATANSGNYGLQINTGTLISFGATSITAVGGAAHAFRLEGTGAKVQSVSDITISATMGGWGLTMYNNSLIQSIGGNILITSNGTGGGMYFGTTGGIYSSSNTANPTNTPTAGGTLTINAIGASAYGIQAAAGSFVSFGAMSITARGAGAYQGAYIYGAGTFKSVGDITIDSATSGGQWGLDFSASRIMQSTAGNILITAVGNFGMYVNGTIAASTSTTDTSATTAPATGGTITINATGRTQQGLEMAAGSLIANNGLTVTGIATGGYHGVYIAGAGSLKAVGDIAITATTTGAQWAFYQTSSRFIQSTAGNISITSTAAAGYGMYINGGGLVAGNNTTTPTAGGSITINSSSSYNDITGAALRLDGHSTKIIAFGDINIYANGAASGLNVANQQGHGIILWGGAQVVRSVNGAISMTGYANREAGGVTNWANISGGVTLYDGGVTIRAKGNLTLNGVSSSGIGLYLTYTSGTGGGITSDTGNIMMNGISNAASYGGAIIRLPVTATLGSVTISGAGQNYAYYQDAWSGSISAKNDVNIIGYATSGHGIYLGTGSVTSSNGNVILSGYTSSTNTGHYGIYSNAINVSANNGSVTFQGSKLDTVSTLANAVSNLSGATPTPLFAIADAGNPASAATNGVYWTGNITANTTSGQINIYAKAPYISGVMTAYGLLPGTANQSYSLTGSNAVISVLAGSIGTGSLAIQTASNLSIGSLSSVDGFTGSGLTITSTATLSQTKPISVSTLTLAGTNGIFDLSLANTLSTSVALNSGTLKVGHSSALGTTSGPLTMAANSILLSNLSTLALSNPITLSGGAATINAPPGHTLTLSGIISSSGNLTINSPTTNTGAVVFTGTNTYTGTTTISAGTLQIGSGSTTGALGTGNITNNAVLVFNRSNDFTVANYSSGTGSITKEGAGVLTLTNVHRATGGTIVNAGTLILQDPGADGHGQLNGTLTVNANGIVQLKGNSTALGWHTIRVSTLNINGGLVEAVGSAQHLWDATVNFSGGGTLRTNGGTSSSSTTSYWEWGNVTVNVTNATAVAEIGGRVRMRMDNTATTYTVADGVVVNDLLLSAALTEANGAGTFTKAGAGTMTVSGANTNTGAITVNAGTLAVTNATGLGTTAGGVTVASGATLDLQNVTVGAENITLNGGTIAASTGTSSLAGTVALGAASTVNVAGNQLTLTGIVSGAHALQKLGVGHLILTATNSYTGTTTIGEGKLTFRNDVPNLTSSSFVGPGVLVVEPAGANFTSAYTFNETLGSATKLGGLTIGKAGSTQDIITSTTINVEGPITLTGGTVAINAAVTTANDALNLTAATAVTQTAAIVAKDVVLQGAGTFTLTNTSNNIESITGGDVTRIGNLSLTDASGGLALNAIVSAGTIRVETVAGDITLAQNLATTSTSTAAIIVNAGRTATVGTITGGNIIVSGTPTITMGTGGIAKLYSGSVSGSTGLADFVGIGSGRFRYNSTQTTSNFTKVLGAGVNAIYREGSSLSGTLSTENMVYGDALPNFSGGSGLVNGDSWVDLNIVSATYSTTNQLKAGSYSVNASGLATLGYNVSSITAGSLTVSAKGLNIQSLSPNHKVYNGNAIATLNGTAAISSGGSTSNDGKHITNDVVSISGTATATFDGVAVQNARVVTVGGLSLTGTDASNYTLTTLTLSANITARPITLTAGNRTKVYGDALTLGTSDFSLTSGTFATSESATAVTLASTGGMAASTTQAVATYSGNITASNATGTGGFLASNYDITYVSGALEITARPITLTAGNRTKIYGETLTLGTSDFSLTAGSFANSESATAVTLASTSGMAASTTQAVATYSGNITASNATGTGGFSVSNYNITYGSGSLEITARPITITANANQTKIYGNTDPTFTYAIEAAGTNRGLFSSDAFTGALARAAGENVGSYAINQGTLANSNYAITFVADNFAITTRPITITANANQTKIYGNTDPTFTYAIEAAGTNRGLFSSDAFTGALARAAGENVGSYAINQGTLANNNYAITFVADNFAITTRPITITANANQTKIYGNTDPTFTYAIEAAGTNRGLFSSDAFTGALARAAGENVGSYAINQGTLANNNYAITFVADNFAITTRPITITANANQTKIYGNTDPTFTYAIEAAGTNRGLFSSDAFTGALARAAGENVGSYAINQGTLANSNYAITFVADNFAITTRPITITANANQTKIYGNTDPTFTYAIEAAGTNRGLFSSDAFTGALARAAGENVGSYAINQGTLANNNYAITFVADNFAITTRPITITANANQTKIYGNTDPTFTYAIEAAGTNRGLFSSDAFTGALARAAGENVGSYAINQGTLANNNYAITFVADNFAITTRPITITANANQTKIYGNTDPTFTYAIEAAGTNRGLFSSDAFTGALARAAGENVGSYAINQGTLANSNYAITFVADNFAITTRPITITANANQTKIYGNTDPTFTYAIEAAGTNRGLFSSDAFTGALARAAGENVGSYAINQGTLANSNYAITFVADNFAITTRPITITANANQTKIYGNTDPTFTYAIEAAGTNRGLFSSDAFTGALARAAGENVGSYAINQGTLANNNYAITFVADNFAITTRPITITANANQTKIYGNTDPTFTYAIEAAGTNRGLFSSDAFTGALARAAGENVGSYAINQGTLANNNYAITFVADNFAITTRPITITANANQTKIYGNTDPTFTYAIEAAGTNRGLFSSDAFTGALARAAGENVGSYAINQGTLANNNYAITFVADNFAITTRPITITANANQTKIYGNTDPTFTYAIEAAGTNRGLFSSDAFTGALARAAGENVGSYAINQGTLANNNYAITFVADNFAITTRPITITANANQTKIYGNTDPTFTYAIEAAGTNRGLFSSDAFTGALARAAGENVGSYAINQGTLANNNYAITFVADNFAITTRPITITANANQTKIYGNTDPTFTYAIEAAGTNRGLFSSDAFTGALARAAGENVGSYAINQGTLANSNYAITFVADNFAITTRPITITANANQTKIYGNTDPTFTYAIEAAGTNRGLFSSDAFTGALARAAGENVGSYAINQGTLANSNYAITFVADNFAITTRPITITANANQTKIYGNTDPTFTYAIEAAGTNRGLFSSDAFTGALARAAGENVGSYAINQGTLANNNYAITFVADNFAITTRPITITANANQTKIYGNTDPTFTYAIEAAGTNRGLFSSDAFTGALARAAGENVGSYAINQGTLANNNYAITFVADNFAITTRPITITANANQTKIYGNTDPTFTYAIEAAGTNRGLFSSDAFTGALARAAGENVGSYAINQGTLANSNYAITFVADNFAITTRPITITANANQTKIYGNTDPTFTYAIEAAGTNRGLFSSDAFTGALARAAGENVGSYAINQGTLANNNYAITFVADNFAITTRPITITANANQTKIYGNTDPTFTYAIEAAGTNRGLFSSDAFTGALARAAGENVGSYAINQGTLANNNYAITFVADNFAITTRPITITANANQTKIYGNTDPTFTYAIEAAGTNRGLFSSDAFTGALARAAGENVGSYAINQGTLANSNYAITFVADNFAITTRPITITANANQTKIYGNTDPTFTYAIEAAGTNRGLFSSDAFTGALARAAGENVGSYAINQGTLANNNYAITFVADNFAITTRPITITANANQTKIYGNTDPTFTYAIEAAGTNRGLFSSDAFTGALARAAGENVGSYAINQGTLANNNYAITFVADNFAITTRPITITANANQTKIYGNTDPTFTYAIEAAGTNRGLFSSDAFTGALARAAGENVGSYAINQGTLANSNYAITFVADNFAITTRPITITANANQTKIYGNTDPTFTYAIEAAGTNLGRVGSDTFTGALARAAGENVGSYAINQGTLANNNYAITFVADNFAITTRPITITANANQTKIYGNTDPTFTYAIEAAGTNLGRVGSDTFTGALARAAGENVGSYAINQGTLANNNYAITFVADNFAITTRPITITANANQTKIYGNTDPTFTYAIEAAGTNRGLFSSDAFTGALARAAGENVGSYAINQGTLANNNYAITFVADNFAITTRPITITANANQTKIYGNTDPTFTYAIEAAGTNRGLFSSDAFTGALARAAGENVGSYAINQGTLANNNYAITFVADNFAITTRPITITANANQTKIYGNTDPTFTYAIEAAGTNRGLFSSDAFTGALARAAGENVGSYAINQGTLANSNYAITFVADNFAITTRPITITANANQTKIYGNTDPTFTYAIEAAGTNRGLFSSDAFTGALARAAGENVGSYAINQGTLANSNYAITFVADNFAITTRPITITANANQTKIYGNTDPTFTYAIEAAGTNRGLFSSDAFTGALARAAGENVGSYAINQGTLANNNYAITFVADNFAITTRPITITANANQTKIYGNTDPTFTYAIEAAGTNRGLFSSDAFTGALARAAGENVGSYAINQGTLANNNYAITFVADNFAITTRPITITANANQTKIYGNTDPTFTYAIEAAGTNRGLFSSDAFTGALARAAGENVGSYAINQGTLANSNYAITFVADNFAITTRPITITANANQTKIYGNTDPTFTYAIEAAGTNRGLFSSDAFTGALARAAGENVGSYAINQGTLANNNYAITFVADNFAITTRPITITANANQTKIYGNTDPTFTYAIEAAGTNRGLFSSDAFTGALARAAGENVGSYAINQGTLANNNYAITFVADNFAITTRPITITANANQTKIYGNTDPTFTYAIEAAGTNRGLFSSDAFTGALARAAGENVGSYAINQGTLANSNYAITFVADNFAITTRPITITANANQTKIYGNTDPTFTYAIEAAGTNLGRVGSDTFTGALARAAGENVGSYAINQGTLANNNYAITFVADNFAITTRPITITANANQTKIYGNTDPTFTYAIEAAGTNLGRVGSDTFTGALARAAGENVGSYAINQGTLANNNYAITFVADNFAITTRPITITANANQTKIYGNTDPTFTYAIEAAGTNRGLFSSDAFTGALARAAGENVGSYAINQGTLANNNYAITFVADNFAITTRPITITANANQTKIYGNTDPTFTYAIEAAGTNRGLFSSDAFTGALARAAGENVGSYAINQGTLANNNYAITFVADNFAITTRPITITANANQTKIYGNTDPTFTYAIEAAGTNRGLFSSDAFTGALARAAGENVGSYAINQGTLANSNYAITFVADNFAITTRPITITANANQTKIYGNTDPTFTYAIEAAGTNRGLFSSDAFTGALARAAGENVGSYAINQGTLANSNYAITFVADNFTITVTNVNKAPVFDISQSNITGVIDIPLPIINVSITSGAVTSFSVSPALPLGLALNTTTGSISGTPIQASASKMYTISGSNSDGIGTASFTLFIDDDLDADGIGDTTDLDIDGDGVSNRLEVLDGTDPKNTCDSVPSSITLPLSQLFLKGDCDGDELTNGQELGLNPTQPTDIDNNGTPDYLEFNNHSASEDDLEVFNSITNNSDNLNDAFIIRGIENYPNNTLYIYNRWGVEVYSVEGYAQDNKYFRGISEGHRTISQSAELPKGTYYYVLRYVNKQGIEKQRTGYLFITK